MNKINYKRKTNNPKHTQCEFEKKYINTSGNKNKKWLRINHLNDVVERSIYLIRFVYTPKHTLTHSNEMK